MSAATKPKKWHAWIVPFFFGSPARTRNSLIMIAVTLLTIYVYRIEIVHAIQSLVVFGAIMYLPIFAIKKVVKG